MKYLFVCAVATVSIFLFYILSYENKLQESNGVCIGVLLENKVEKLETENNSCFSALQRCYNEGSKLPCSSATDTRCSNYQ